MNANPYLTDAQRTVFECTKVGAAGQLELEYEYIS